MPKSEIVSVITDKDAATGLFKAYAVRSSEGSRDVLLSSEPWDKPVYAVESLHTKSCEAVRNYLDANGFSYPLDLKSRFGIDDDDDDEKDRENEDDDDVASVGSSQSASSTVALSYWGSSDDEAAMTPASSADPHASNRGIPSHEKGSHISRRRSKPPAASKQAREASSRFPTEPDDSDDEHLPRQSPPRVRLVSPIRSTSAANTSYRPPPPPPGWTGPPMPPPPMRGIPIPIPTPQSQPGPHYSSPGQQQPPPAFSTAAMPSNAPPPKARPAGAGPSPDAPPPPPTRGPVRVSISAKPHHPSLHYQASAPSLNPNRNSIGFMTTTTPPNAVHHLFNHQCAPLPQQQHHHHQQHHQQQQHLYDVRLTIRWPGHGEQHILESSRASVRALQELALAYVRTHPADFPSPSSLNHHGTGGSGVRACVRRAVFGPREAYDMSTYRGDDITKLFNVLSAGGIPRFEVEVEEVSLGPGAGARPQMH